MNCSAIISSLRAHEDELRRLGVASLSIFGSAARNGAGDASDVDLAVRLDRAFCRGGFDYFARLDALQARLADLLGCAVDIIEEPVERGSLQREIDRDRVIAF